MKPLFSVFAAVILLISACGDNGSESTPTGDSPEEAEATSPSNVVAAPSAWVSDPCSLIGDEEMSDLLPNPVAGSVVSAGLCEYGPVDLNLGRVDVEVFVQDVTATGCDLLFSMGGFSNAELVDGVGTAARWKGGAKQLGVCVDNEELLAVTVYDPDQKTDPLATARAVAELVIARLTDR